MIYNELKKELPGWEDQDNAAVCAQLMIIIRLNRYKSQRDELLATLIELRDVAERCDGWSQFPRAALEKANAAITKCENN